MRARTDLGFVDLLQPLQRLARVAGLLYMHVVARVQTRSLAPSLSIYQVPASLTYPPVPLVPLFTAAISTCLPTLTAQPTEQLTQIQGQQVRELGQALGCRTPWATEPA